MFIISQKASYTWPVTVEFPVDGGKTERQTFDAEFRRIPQSRMADLRKQIEAGDVTDMDICLEVLTGWAGVTDDRGESVPFSEGAKAQLLDVPLVAAAVVMAWMQSLTGAKRKN